MAKMGDHKRRSSCQRNNKNIRERENVYQVDSLRNEEGLVICLEQRGDDQCHIRYHWIEVQESEAHLSLSVRHGKTGQTRLTRNPINPFKNDPF